MGALGLTEPSAGSDAGGTKTTARLDGDEWVINGSKIFITNAGEAETYVVTAITDKEAKPRHKGISAFIMEKDTPGFTFGKKEHKLGIPEHVEAELWQRIRQRVLGSAEMTAILGQVGKAGLLLIRLQS